MSVWWIWTAVALAAPSWDRLYSPEGSATSFLRSNWNKYTENYHPNYAFDDNVSTAWVEGVDGDGLGEILSWNVSPLTQSRAIKLRIRNGYQKSDILLAANSAPKDVVITVWRGREQVAEKRVTLQPTMGFQDIEIETAGKGLNHIELRIESVTAGTKYKDTCISDIETWVDSDAKYNEPFELSKKAVLAGWAADRLKTAKYFALLPNTWPFAAREFTADPEVDETEAQFLAAAAPLRSVLERLSAAPTWFSAAKQNTAPGVAPDGLDLLEPFLRYVRSADVAFFEAKQKDAQRVEETDEEMGYASSRWSENFKLERTDGVVRYAATRWGSVENGRITVTNTTDVLVGYDTQGRITTARVLDTEDGDGTEISEKILLFRWNPDGKIDRIEEHERKHWSVLGHSSESYHKTVYHP